MSKHHQSSKNNSRRGKFIPKVRPGEMPRWSNGVLLNGINGSRNDRPVGSNTRTTSRSHDRTSTTATPAAKPAIGRVVMQEHSHGRKNRVLVLTKREAMKGFHAPYTSRFESTKPRNDGSKGGSDFIAKVRVHGRPVFLDSRSPKPSISNRDYGFELVGENAACTVYFARIIAPESIVMPSSISVDVKTGKMVANNARLPKLSHWKSKKPIERVDLPVSDEPDFDDLFGDHWDRGYDSYGLGSYDFGCDECDSDECTCNHGEEMVDLSYFEVELREKEMLRPQYAKWCHNCGCRICECDGTPQVDGQPYLMPRHLTDVRMPKYTPPRKPRTPRYAGWRW